MLKWLELHTYTNKKDSKFLAVLGLAYVVGNSVLFAQSKELTTVTWIE